MGPVDPARDIETLNEDESEYVEDSECDQSEQPLSLGFANDTASSIGVIDSGSEDYRFNTGKTSYFFYHKIIFSKFSLLYFTHWKTSVVPLTINTRK